jgi:two-component system response regulator HydG
MNGRRLLIADDDLEMRSWLREVLGERGALILEADSGAELLRMLAEEGPFDLVITDVRMSWADGVQVLQMARTAGYETPFVVITAFANDRVRAQVAELGAVLLEKPFEVEQLVEKARGALAPWSEAPDSEGQGS